MSKQIGKKRSSILDKSMLTPPASFDHKKYAGRWVAESRLHARSDGFEPRGFHVWKDSNGQMVKSGDLVWCYMAKDEALAHKQELYEAARGQMVDLNDQMQSNDDRLSFELEQAGGKIETKLTIE